MSFGNKNDTKTVVALIAADQRTRDDWLLALRQLLSPWTPSSGDAFVSITNHSNEYPICEICVDRSNVFLVIMIMYAALVFTNARLLPANIYKSSRFFLTRCATGSWLEKICTDDAEGLGIVKGDDGVSFEKSLDLLKKAGHSSDPNYVRAVFKVGNFFLSCNSFDGDRESMDFNVADAG